MDTKTGKIRELAPGEEPRPGEVQINMPRPGCPSCGGAGSVPRLKTTRAYRRRAEKKGVSPGSNFYPCPECSGI